MGSSRLTRARPWRLARSQGGSFLVEAMVSALIIVIVGLGVLKIIDRSARLGGEQKTQAVAGNVGQTEQELVRALPLAEQSNLRRTTTRSVGGVAYTSESRTDWVDDSSGEPDCTSAGSDADYLKLSTVVTWPQIGRRSPVMLESLITPGVRAFGAGQGSLAIHVTRADGSGVSDLPLNLSGGATLSDATNASGCVLWGYLDATASYRVAFSRSPDFVAADGSAAVDKPVAVVGGQTSTISLLYDQGGRLRSSFVTKRSRLGSLVPTFPQVAHVTNAGGGGVSVGPIAVSGSTMTSGLLFGFTSAYTIHADACAAAEVVYPAIALPRPPVAPDAASAVVTAGTTTTSPDVQLPPLMVAVTSGGSPVDGAIVRVTTPCGTVYRRATGSDGTIDDPGFPYAASLSVCVSDGTRQRVVSASNVNFNVTQLPVALASTDPLGSCA